MNEDRNRVAHGSFTVDRLTKKSSLFDLVGVACAVVLGIMLLAAFVG